MMAQCTHLMTSSGLGEVLQVHEGNLHSRAAIDMHNDAHIKSILTTLSMTALDEAVCPVCRGHIITSLHHCRTQTRIRGRMSSGKRRTVCATTPPHIT